MPQIIVSQLNLHPFPAFLIDRRCKILGSNRRATSLLGRKTSFFRISSNHLSLDDTDADARLRDCAAQTAPEGQATAIRVQNSEGGPSHLVVVQSLAEREEGKRMLLVSARLWDDATIFNVQHVMNVLALTVAEAELAVALASGRTIREYAEQTKRKVPTVRWHLSNMLRKTGCRDQADLARVVFLTSL